MMSNKPSFGRDVGEFLRGREPAREESCHDFGVHITALIPFGGEKVTVRVSVSSPYGREESEFVLMREHSERLELSVGGISEEMLPELEYYAEVARAYNSACASLAYTQSSLRALVAKLSQKGFPRDICLDAVECVRERGFINEGEVAVRRAQLCVEKRWGRSRISAKLREEGFEESALHFAQSYLDEVDFVALCREMIEKKYGTIPEDRHDRELLCAALSRLGYSPSEIRSAMALCQKK
jgi:SOS response regulatory protein OraA/RecX